ncbi:MAG: glycoside hydrolase TIM-barrel-like domain-containing protein [Pseudomonadota bacterium]
MATLLLSAAGSAVGGAIGGSLLGVSAATVGQVAGAVAGAVIDSRLFRSGSEPVEAGRASNLRIQGSTEGAVIPTTYGRMRVAGQLIWSTKYLEKVTTTRQGGKGGGGSSSGQTVREFSYCISIAVAVGAGPIDRIGRIWADGKLLDTQGLTFRVYRGTADQQPDPKIMAVEGADRVPAYRGTAYVVFEDLPVGQFGDRIPQLNFEVFRAPPELMIGDTEEIGERLNKLVKGVALSPGTGEWALDTQPVRYTFPQGGDQFANVNNSEGRPDALVALDQLEADLPEADSVNLIVSWFGTDLRIGECRVEPRIEARDRNSAPLAWSVSGLTSTTANLVSRSTDGRPNYGGTPDDGSLIRLIQELNARGKRVMLYPFLLMDVPEGNELTNPYTGALGQPVFPWRGRITASAAPGQAGSPDLTAAMTAEVQSFFGTVSASDFSVGGGVSYSGPAEFTWSRFVLHLSALAQAAGGVDSICIGSEFRGMTTLRSDRTVYPAVNELKRIAGEVRSLLPDAKIGYAADWTEYFGHQPQDGSNDVIFHLDPLWSDPNIDFVGIDDYTPLSDWRYQTDHLDRTAGAASVYSLPYLNGNVEGGEYYDYFYADEAAKTLQDRTPIADTAHGEDWVFRPKDIRGWWQNAHHNRIGGVREAASTGWVPQSKPVWLTETGCPAIDLGGNQPNLFYDPKSSESAIPFGSVGARDDEMQRRFLQAKLAYWQEAANNPISTVYGTRMIPDDRVFVWTWDARPFPDFPTRESVWADGPSYDFGHWLTGRVSASSLAEVVADILLNRGITQFDVSALFGSVEGYQIEQTLSARQALQSLMQTYGFDAFEAQDRIVFVMRDLRPSIAIPADRFVENDDPTDGPVMRERTSAGATVDAVRLSFVEAESDYRLGAVDARQNATLASRVAESSLPIALSSTRARLMAQRLLAEAMRTEETVRFSLPQSELALEPGDLVDLPGSVDPYRIETIVDGVVREITAVRVERSLTVPAATLSDSRETELPLVPGPIEQVFLDLPVVDDDGKAAPAIAATADPWPGEVGIYVAPGSDGFELIAEGRQPASIGSLVEDLPPGQPNRWQRISVDVALSGAGISSADILSVFNGSNTAALRRPDGEWELLQFREAVLIAPGRYRLSGLLRGQRGTEGLAPVTLPAGTEFVLLDNAVVPVPLSGSARGLQRTWRIGPANFGFAHPSYVETVQTFTGKGLRPFAPAQLRAKGTFGQDIEVSWVRQTRLNGDGWEQVEVPLGEEVEQYRLRILQGGATVREVTRTQPSFTYSAAQQAEDGVGPGAEVAVSQFSTTVGFGPERRILING